MSDFEKDTVHLARMALGGRSDDVAALSRRLLREVSLRRPDLAPLASSVLETIMAAPVRAAAQPLPVDLDSRLELLRREFNPQLQFEPVWPVAVREQLDAVVQERNQEDKLVEAGVAPTRSLLFVGPPGVGKTLAAKWLAIQTKRPLLTLDLAAVMSSFLGRTGNNIRVVLEFARRTPSVLLLDEFDAIAKRRDDTSELGELKRLVTVLLQSVDDWPSTGILVAATNHRDLLDPAVWRRFDRVVEFPLPNAAEAASAIGQLLDDAPVEREQIALLASLLGGRSFADVSRAVMAAKRAAVVNGVSISDAIRKTIVGCLEGADQEKKIQVARSLMAAGQSERAAADAVRLARETVRKHLGKGKTRTKRDEVK